MEGGCKLGARSGVGARWGFQLVREREREREERKDKRENSGDRREEGRKMREKG